MRKKNESLLKAGDTSHLSIQGLMHLMVEKGNRIKCSTAAPAPYFSIHSVLALTVTKMASGDGDVNAGGSFQSKI